MLLGAAVLVLAVGLGHAPAHGQPMVGLTACCALHGAEWATLLGSLSTFRANMTTLIAESFEVSSQGVVSPSASSIRNETASHIPAVHALGLEVLALVPMSAGATALAHNSTVRSVFFAALDAEMAASGWDGVALDLEGPHGPNGPAIMAMLNELGDRLHAAAGRSRKLVVFVHTCPSADFSLACGWFNASSTVHALITMDTYTASRSSWLRAFDGAIGSRIDTSHYAPGFEYNQQLSPFDDGARNLDYMLAKGVDKLVVWNLTPPHNPQAYFALFGAFLHQAASASPAPSAPRELHR